MELKKQSRPEDIIVGTDPVAIDIIQQIYSAIKDKNEADRTFLERCWVLGIEKAYKTETKKLDPELCTKLLERIYFHLEHKNVWEVEENKLYDIFEKIISLKTLKDTRISDIFNKLETALGNVLQLDFSQKVELHDSLLEKRNIFNYIIFFFNSIIEKMEMSVVSTKAINSFFSLYPGIGLMVTSKEGKIRFINENGVKLLSQSTEDTLIGADGKNFIENYSKIISRLHKDNKVSDFKTNLISKEGKLLPVTISVPPISRDASEIDEIVFVITQ